MNLTWIPIKEKCQHCGAPLEAAYNYNDTSLRMVGEYPLLYRHSVSGELDCVVTKTYKVRPYRTSFEMKASFDEARSKFYEDEE